MPIYAYKCNDCGTKYEIFHKVREEKENIACPSCRSDSAKRLMSVTSISGFNKSADLAPYPTCNTGMCSGGSC